MNSFPKKVKIPSTIPMAINPVIIPTRIAGNQLQCNSSCDIPTPTIAPPKKDTTSIK